MSKQFTYIIDEQSLRGKLTSMITPLREDAWTRFDSYASLNMRPVETNRLRNFNIPLNRNTMLPAAFAMIIVFFSFLLFNFISINPKKASLTPQVTSASVPFPQVTVEPLSAAPVQPQTFSADNSNQVAVKSPEAGIVTEPVAEIEKPLTMAKPANAIVADESLLNASASQVTKKRRPADVLGASQIQEIRPTAVTEDMDPEVRPN